MTAKNKISWLAAVLLISVSAETLRAQDAFSDSFGDSDLQFFSPVDFDFEDRPLRKDFGYFFRYDKLSWALPGERTTIGDSGRTALAEEVFLDNPNDQGTRPDPYVVHNGIQNAPPRAEFGWGERYELGYSNRGNGWQVGILDGPEAVSSSVFGFGENTPFIDQDYTDATDIPVPVDPVTGFQPPGGPVADTRAFGFGSVPVNFETPDGFLTGFQDYLHFIGGSELGTDAGPILYVGNYGTTGVEGIDIDDDGIFFRRADDKDGDGLNGGGFILVDTDGDGTPDLFLSIHDWDDLTEFNVFFDEVSVRNITKVDGVEIMRTLDLSNRHKMAKNQGSQLEIGYGVRYLRLKDQFQFEGLGSVLGRTSVDNQIENNVVGPQIRAKWRKQRGRFNFGIDGRFLFGYNVSNWEQTGLVGEELIPSALNRPLFGRSTATAYGRQDNDFSPVVEFRAETSYQVTSSIALKLGYNATFMDNIGRASSTVRWRLPDWGFKDEGTQEIFINGISFGFDVVY